MKWMITKYLLTAAVVVVVSEVAKRNDKLGALLVALPMVTILSMIWLHLENQPLEKIANHAWYTFWYVIPTLPMFLIFPVIVPRIGFWWSLLVSILITIGFFWIFAAFVRLWGIELNPAG
ncbi:MAG: DUF3147 family protein [Candidatus Cloacimonetes bacterium]|nr:DUF3147 family protein [Candidatus Cloacimonadota bacterium]